MKFCEWITLNYDTSYILIYYFWHIPNGWRLTSGSPPKLRASGLAGYVNQIAEGHWFFFFLFQHFINERSHLVLTFLSNHLYLTPNLVVLSYNFCLCECTQWSIEIRDDCSSLQWMNRGTIGAGAPAGCHSDTLLTVQLYLSWEQLICMEFWLHSLAIWYFQGA